MKKKISSSYFRYTRNLREMQNFPSEKICKSPTAFIVTLASPYMSFTSILECLDDINHPLKDLSKR